MAYLNMYAMLIQIFFLIRAFCMKTCTYCNSVYQPIGSSNQCSIKCKLLANIKKTETNCWLYKNTTSGPYSKLRWNGKWYSGHRCSWEVFNGKIPDKMWVCHSCDTPKCINPDHLFVGTQSDNIKDSVKKGRFKQIGEGSHLSRFTDIQIEEMRSLRAEGFSYERLIRIFDSSWSHIYAVCKNKIRMGIKKCPT